MPANQWLWIEALEKVDIHCHYLHWLCRNNNRQYCKVLTEVAETWLNTTHIDKLVQERRNSIANALELRLPCTNQSIYNWDQRNQYVFLPGEAISLVMSMHRGASDGQLPIKTVFPRYGDSHVKDKTVAIHGDPYTGSVGRKAMGLTSEIRHVPAHIAALPSLLAGGGPVRHHMCHSDHLTFHSTILISIHTLLDQTQGYKNVQKPAD